MQYENCQIFSLPFLDQIFSFSLFAPCHLPSLHLPPFHIKSGCELSRPVLGSSLFCIQIEYFSQIILFFIVYAVTFTQSHFLLFCVNSSLISCRISHRNRTIRHFSVGLGQFRQTHFTFHSHSDKSLCIVYNGLAPETRFFQSLFAVTYNIPTIFDKSIISFIF